MYYITEIGYAYWKEAHKVLAISRISSVRGSSLVTEIFNIKEGGYLKKKKWTFLNLHMCLIGRLESRSVHFSPVLSPETECISTHTYTLREEDSRRMHRLRAANSSSGQRTFTWPHSYVYVITCYREKRETKFYRTFHRKRPMGNMACGTDGDHCEPGALTSAQIIY
jgi:hypothetical protein